MKEDMLLHPILEGRTKNKNSNLPYRVFTPFKKNLINNYKVKKINEFSDFKFKNEKKLETIQFYFKNLDSFYIKNDNVLVKGGRTWALNRLKNIKKFNQYNTKRDFLSYETTMLSASINFNVVSIREIYYNFKKIRNEK